MSEEDRERILKEIIDRELRMFLATPNEGGPASCQQRPETFKVMRRMAHLPHSDEYLASYLSDLQNAERAGRNFMLEKYARMDNLIPPLQDNPLLDEIADAETSFLDAAAIERPDLVRRNSSGMFRNYLRCELETLSPETLDIYARELRDAKLQGRNPVLERHSWLARILGGKE